MIIYGNVPSKSNCYRITHVKGHASLAKTTALRRYENQFFIQAPAEIRNLAYNGFFEIHIDVYYPSQRSDLDNSLKIILDSLQKKTKTIKNDNKCVKIVAQKFVDKKEPRVEFVLKKIDN